MVDRDEPEMACSEWHGHGTAGEDDRGSGLSATVYSSGDGRGPSTGTAASLASAAGVRQHIGCLVVSQALSQAGRPI